VSSRSPTEEIRLRQVSMARGKKGQWPWCWVGLGEYDNKEEGMEKAMQLERGCNARPWGRPRLEWLCVGCSGLCCGLWQHRRDELSLGRRLVVIMSCYAKEGLGQCTGKVELQVCCRVQGGGGIAMAGGWICAVDVLRGALARVPAHGVCSGRWPRGLGMGLR